MRGLNFKTYYKNLTPEQKKEHNLRKIKGRLNNGKPWHSEQTRHKMKTNHKGSKGKHWKKTPEQCENSRKANLGDKNPSWKNGATLKNYGLRATREYKLWKKAVKERDDFTCIWCGSKENIEADHIKPFALYPELRLAIDNGRTLCKKCHETTDTYAGRVNKFVRSLTQN